MELTDLLYDCLSCIFDCIPDLKLLLDLSTVCKQWNILAKRRLNKIRHLHAQQDIDSNLSASPNHLYTNDVELMERVNVSKIFPNLKFFSKCYTLEKMCTCKMLVNVLSTSKPLIGLICEAPCLFSSPEHLGSRCHVDVDEIVKHCGSLEYLVTLYRPFLRSYFLKYKFGRNLKYFEGSIEGSEYEEDRDYNFIFKEMYLICYYLHQMPNLEVLHMKEPPCNLQMIL
ncbi:uncharacterized protein LOC128387398 [Panonychus citri]|uniref:uncharacterized protein LOC128387398 n=1 Tax=Panonychus citri TaxID=50023 RepID=UPI002307CC05|nr:uncharacterized protein LOC128387398 [Panonychus citri]